ESFLGAREALGKGDSEAAELVRRVAHADADLDPAATQIVENREILGEAQWMTERQEADVGGEADSLSSGRHRSGDRRPRGQVAVVDEVVLGEPHEIEAEAVEPRDLLDDLRV